MPAAPSRTPAGDSARPASTPPRPPDPTQGHEGRLAPLRAELLPAVPAAARMAQPIDTSTSHLGFRCISGGDELRLEVGFAGKG